MNGKRVRENTFAGSGFFEEKARERLAFSVGQEPPDDVPAVDVEDDVQVIVRPLLPPEKLGVSGAEEFHPRALSEPDVSLSAHPAPIIEPPT